MWKPLIVYCNVPAFNEWPTNFKLLFQVLPFIVAIVGIIHRRGLRNEVCFRNQPNKSNLALYKPLLHFYSHLKQLYMSNKTALQL